MLWHSWNSSGEMVPSPFLPPRDGPWVAGREGTDGGGHVTDGDGDEGRDNGRRNGANCYHAVSGGSGNGDAVCGGDDEGNEYTTKNKYCFVVNPDPVEYLYVESEIIKATKEMRINKELKNYDEFREFDQIIINK